MGAPRIISIYTLSHPVTKRVMYVGKSNNPSLRLLKHLGSEASFRVQSWVLELASQGLRPVMSIVDHVTEEEADSAERLWIGRCRVEGKLLNVAGIGNGERCRDWNGNVRSAGWLKRELRARARKEDGK